MCSDSGSTSERGSTVGALSVERPCRSIVPICSRASRSAGAWPLGQSSTGVRQDRPSMRSVWLGPSG